MRHEYVWDEDTSWQCWGYFDRIRRNDSAFAMTQDTYDLDCQYQFSPREFHHCIAGANYRLVHDNTSGGFSLSLVPPSYSTQWSSVFASDTMTLYEDYLYFTLGIRLEYNSFGKFQPEPTARSVMATHSTTIVLGCRLASSAQSYPHRNGCQRRHLRCRQRLLSRARQPEPIARKRHGLRDRLSSRSHGHLFV